MESELENDAEGKPLSKSALKKLQAAQEKERRKQETQARLEAEKAQNSVPDCAVGSYGNLPLVQSAEKSARKWHTIAGLSESNVEQSVLLRGRLHNSRGRGKQCFIVLRQQFETLQIIAAVDNVHISKEMVQFCMAIPKESIVDVEGVLVKAAEPVKSCSIHDYELHLRKVFVVSEVKHRLPISIEDASRPEQDEETEEDGQFTRVNLDTRLDHRIIDLRTVTNQAIFTISHGMNAIMREFFVANNFREIHSPKIMEAASEGGANVFKITYFKREAFLAQSPQFAKQMAICADFERVFEFTPVFRAENSFTHRHMTEFTGVDMEMTFHEHYHEVVQYIGKLFTYLFTELKSRYAKEIEVVKRQFPFDELTYPDELLILTYAEAIQLLRESGEVIGDLDDINTTQEKLLGRLVKAKYNTDFYALDKFPLCVRPFYTMPDPHNPLYSNSYDFFMRGEEILSGAQRIHDYDMLSAKAAEHQIELPTIQSYLDAFKYGAPPHAGGGIGLERVVMFYLGLNNIRRASLFPRDPKRLSP